MLRRRSLTASKPFAALALALALVLSAGRAGAAEEAHPLQLEVQVNDTPTQLIGSFTKLGRRRIAARRAELEELGLNPGSHTPPDQLIILDEVVGLSYRYDEPGQRISITVVNELRITNDIDASPQSQGPIPARADYGGVLNYTLFTASSAHLDPRAFAFSGASATLDGRAFTPFGTLSQSAILRTSFDDRFEALRLNTTFTYSDPESLTTYRAGDEITGGLAWTRPVRIGGFQAQRNFGLRSDLVTLPLPSVSGSAAVPSTVDVYVNNLKTFSQEVGTGPYRISNLPVVSGSGTARVVLRDSAGRETETSLPFYASPNLLAPGLSYFSLEGGFPRLSYATTSDTYVAKPVVAASLRKGLFDWLTVEGHTEAGAGLVNGGTGVVVPTGYIGIASVAAAASYFKGNAGLQTYAAYETKVLGININASSQRTFGPYDDLASVTARLQSGAAAINQNIFDILANANPNASIGATSASLWRTARPPKALNRISIGMPLPFDSSSFSASFIHLIDASGINSKIVTASWSRALDFNVSAFVTAFSDLGDRKNTGFFVGLSMPLGGSVTASTSVSGGRGGTSVNFDAAKPLEQTPGSVGWRVRDSEGSTPYRSAAVAYRSSIARTETSISNDRNGTRATAEVEGAIATMGNGVFFANRIDDSFAVIETGVPGVEVSYENRPVAVTDSSGRALVPGLRSYQKNKVAINTRNLPVDADIATTQDIVVPNDRSGVRLNFAVQTDVRPAILVLTGADGNPLPAGARGQVEGGETFVIGYDGRAYVKGLDTSNAVTVALADHECHASFAYSPRPNEQVVISPVKCQ